MCYGAPDWNGELRLSPSTALMWLLLVDRRMTGCRTILVHMFGGTRRRNIHGPRETGGSSRCDLSRWALTWTTMDTWRPGTSKIKRKWCATVCSDNRSSGMGSIHDNKRELAMPVWTVPVSCRKRFVTDSPPLRRIAWAGRTPDYGW